MIVGEAVSVLRSRGGRFLRKTISGDDGLQPSELASANDHGLFGPASSAWRIHRDSSMFIGGLRALIIQTLHPLAMAGVADHSDYRHDPWGRLHRTSRFIGTTTFGNTSAAEQMIAVVKRIHEQVEGTAPDGRNYAATDPHLLLWVHATEVDSFLTAYERYGTGRLTDAEKDRYVSEMAEIGVRLGCEPELTPTTRAELATCIEGFRDECQLGDQARDGLRFLINPPVALQVRGAYGLISAAAFGTLPPWAQRMIAIPLPPLVDPLAIRPAAKALTKTIGWLMNSERSTVLEDRLLSSS